MREELTWDFTYLSPTRTENKIQDSNCAKGLQLIGKISVNEIISELSKMERIVKKSGAECFATVSGTIEKIIDLFKDMKPMD